MKPRLRYRMPSFLKRVDLYLLQRYPIVWETKVLHVLFYSLVLANIVLVGVGFALPVSYQSLPEYTVLVNRSLFWTGILAGLSFAYYTYLQTFVRIQLYSFKQNALRFALYGLVVSSLLSNLLIVPYTVIFRVKMLYSKEEIAQDFAQIVKAQMLRDIVLFMFEQSMFYEDKTIQENVIKAFRNTEIGKTGEAEQMLRALKSLQQFCLYLPDRNEKKNNCQDSNVSQEKQTVFEQDINLVRQFIDKQAWGNALKTALKQELSAYKIYYPNQENEWHNYHFEMATQTVQKIYAKYPSETVTVGETQLYRNEYPQKSKLYDNLLNVRDYFRANVFLQLAPWGRQENLLNNLLFPEAPKNLQTSYAVISRYWENLIERTTDKDKFVGNFDDMDTQITLFKERMPLFVQEIGKQSQWDKIILPVAHDFTPYNHLLGYSLLMIGLFAALFVLIAKSLTLQNVLASVIYVSLLALLAWGGLYVSSISFDKRFGANIPKETVQMQKKEAGKQVTPPKNDTVENAYFSTSLNFGAIVMTILMAIVIAIGIFTYAFQAHTRTLERFWVFLLVLSFMLAGYMTVASLGVRFSQVLTSSIKTNYIVYVGTCSFLALLVVAMYSLYNKMMGYPVRK